MAELSGQMTPVIIVTAFICFCPNALVFLFFQTLKDVGRFPSLPLS